MRCAAMSNRSMSDTCRAAASACASFANGISLIVDTILVSIFVIFSIRLQGHAEPGRGNLQAAT